MEKVKKHQVPIAIAAAAVGVLAFGYYAYSRKNSSIAHALVSIDEERKNIDGKTWPSLRRVIDPSAPKKVQ